MPRLLRALGLALIVVSTVLLVAGEAGIVSSAAVDRWFLRGLQAGGLALLAGVALSLLAPFGRMATQTRCARCGTRIEKGQTYCHDHLQSTVREYQDQTRGRR